MTALPSTFSVSAGVCGTDTPYVFLCLEGWLQNDGSWLFRDAEIRDARSRHRAENSFTKLRWFLAWDLLPLGSLGWQPQLPQLHVFPFREWLWSDAEKWTDMNWYFLGYLDLLSYLILLFLFFSLLVTMCRTLPQSVSCKVCLPILVELAPSSRKSGIMAWQVALEGVSSIVVASIIGVSWPESQEANELVESLWRCMKKVSGHLFYAPPYVQSWSKRYILTAH